MLDLRLPVGLFFLLIGAILGIDGLIHPIKTAGVDLVLNRDWGGFLFLFGAVMTAFGARAQKRGGEKRGGEKRGGEKRGGEKRVGEKRVG